MPTWSQRQDLKRDRRNKLLIGLIVIFLMVTSIFGLIVGQSPASELITELEYKDYTFKIEEPFYLLTLGGNEYRFYYFPTDVLNISTEVVNIIENSYYFAFLFDPEGGDLEFVNQAVYDLTNYFEANEKATATGITQNSTRYELPVISCDDATPQVPVLYFNVSNETSINVEQSCIILNSNREGFLKIRDSLIYKLLGVTE